MVSPVFYDDWISIHLLIFDEVQDCPKVINSMKYFCENAPEYHIACAGSLLGIALAKPSSFPVGKVNFMQIDPMIKSETSHQIFSKQPENG